MKRYQVSFFFSFALLLSVQLVQARCSAASQPSYDVFVGSTEGRTEQNFFDKFYLDLSRERSNLAEITAEISSWDEDTASPLWQLNKYIVDGNSIALKDTVIEALAYAESVVEEQSNNISQDQLDKINDSLDALACNIRKGNLNPDKCCPNAPCPSIIKVREKLYVFDRAKFFDCVTFKKCVKFDECIEDLCVDNLVVNNCMGDLCVDDLEVINCMNSLCINSLSVVDESVSGILSVNEVIAENVSSCDVIVGCNLFLNDSISPAVGNVIKNCQKFIHTFPVGSQNTFVGENAGNFTLTGTQGTAFGYQALMNLTDGFFNVAVGNLALTANTEGFRNVAVGSGTMVFNITGHENTAVGDFALNRCTTSDNTAVGVSALLFATTASRNTAVGAFAMQNTSTGFLNTAIGGLAMIGNTTGSENVAIGHNVSASGSFNANVGSQAGFGTGSKNVCLGYNALGTNSDQNVAIGFDSMASSSSAGGDNTGVGYQSLRVVRGSFNIAIGSGAGLNSTLNTSNNNIYIGNIGANESGVIRIGTSGTHMATFVHGINGVVIAGGVPVITNATGQLGTVVSSERFKHDIADMGNESASILNLRPVTFVHNNDESETKQYGLIAEEVEQVFPAIVVNDEEGKPFTVQYQVLPVLLLNELIKQQAAIEDMNNRLVALEDQY